MSTWIIDTSDNRSCAVEADDVRVTPAGALVLLHDSGPPPAPLQPAVIMSARLWRMCRRDDGEQITWRAPEAAWGGGQPYIPGVL
jgi:hypothetical protein